MIGWDFSIFWQIGQAILAGHSPYSVEFSRYPPAASYLFTLFALLPFTAAFAVWSGVNVVLFVHGLRRMRLGVKGLIWLAYTPLLFNLLTGQLDVIFWWAATYLVIFRSADDSISPAGWRKWIPVLAAAFMTLKPQLAVVVLPWFLLDWLRRERGLLLKWLGVCLVIHALPLLADPQIYQKWLEALSGVSEMKMGVSAGIFAFGLLGLPTWLLAVPGLALAGWGLFQDEGTSRAANLSSFPLTIWYDDLLLAGRGPAWLMVPLSWLAFVGAALAQNSLPLVMIPLGALAWQVWKRNQ